MSITGRSNLVRISGLVVAHETEKARLFKAGPDRKFWLPKSWHEWDEEKKVLEIEESKAVDKEIDDLVD